jgi:hypothetical protein
MVLMATLSGPAAVGDWDSEYKELQSQLQHRPVSPDTPKKAYMLDTHALIWPEDRDPLDVELRRAQALSAHLLKVCDSTPLRHLDEALGVIAHESSGLDPVQDAGARRGLYDRVRRLRRQIALANLLLDFDQIPLTTGGVIGHAMQGHLKGFAGRSGSLYVLSGYKSDQPALHDILADARVVSGRNQGEALTRGACNTFDLSFDGRTIVFAWCAKKPPQDLGEDSIYNPSHYTPDNTFNIYRINVPVEADGSAYFEAPIECEIYFQALDQQGRAVQSMRSGTYVHPGEQMTCTGCHEDKWKSITHNSTPLALRRPPSPLEPEVSGLQPISFYRLVKPVLETRCLPCHQQNKVRLDHTEYKRLWSYAFYFHASGSDASLVPVHGGHRTIPGQFGARASRMGEVLFGQQHQQYLKEGKFTEEDVRRLTLWLDCNSMELGSASIQPEDLAGQRAGEVVWPELDFDLANPQRIERLQASQGVH